jgi:hypothetical protein
VKKLVAIVALGTFLVAAAPVTAHAHGAALGLAAFAAFTSLVALPFVAAAAVAPYSYPYPYAYPYGAAPYPAVYSTPAYYAPPPVYAAPAIPAIQREVVYPHGRHVLYGDGVRTAYQWVWVPNPPPPAPNSGATSAVPPPPAGTPPPPPAR